VTKVAVVGVGAWGTALAMHGARRGLTVSLLGRRSDWMDAIESSRRHPALPGIEIPVEVGFTSDARRAFSDADILLWSVGVQEASEELRRLEPELPTAIPFISTSKGIEAGTGRRTTEMIEYVTGRRHGVGVLSGPTFALEVAMGLPAVAVVAAREPEVSEFVQEVLSSPTMRLYRTSDVCGVEIAGAAKNVVAIAAGIVDGLKLGQNTRAALLTRALAEIRRLGTRLGGAPDTFAGLAGVGDLVLTATGDLSRNRRVGLALATGQSLSEAIAALGGQTAEGVATAEALRELARAHGVEMPIVETVCDILSGFLPPREAVRRLMTRDLKDERY
jgi:glycerol-3-phosphate dehydrogenase (NAD(P)+)